MRKILVVLVCMGLMAGIPLPVQAALPVEEAGLGQGSQVYEVNPDGQGGLWISDWGTSNGLTGKVWRINTSDSSVVYYDVPGLPTDARGAGDYFWWIDGGTGLIGRAEVGIANETTVASETWVIPFEENIYEPVLYGSMVDSSGRLWATDAFYEYFYRLTLGQDPNPDSLCTFELPNLGGASYLAYQHPFLWIGDNANSILYRLDVTDETFSFLSWTLSGISSPIGMVVDSDGDLWYADYYLSAVAELDPDWQGDAEGKLSSYPIGNYLTAITLTIEGSHIWFTGNDSPIIGMLNPNQAYHMDEILTTNKGQFSVTCVDLAPVPGTLTRTIDTLTWDAPADYPLDTLGYGLQVYAIPPDLSGAIPLQSSPWGVAYQNGKIWVADTGRMKLLQIDPLLADNPSFVYIPLIQR